MSSMTRSGSTAPRRRCLDSSRRRLLAESVAIVFAVREPSEERELIGLPELVLEGLGETDARALLATVVPGDSMSSFATGLSPRRAAIRSRSWICRGA